MDEIKTIIIIIKSEGSNTNRIQAKYRSYQDGFMSIDPPLWWVVLGGIPVRGIVIVVVVIIIGRIVLLSLYNESYIARCFATK